MRETERIADQLKRAFYGDAWSGPSVKESLEGITTEMASTKPIPNAHSIWELVHHITAWVDIARRRAAGEVVNVTENVNFPPVNDMSEGAWNESVLRMERTEQELRNAILQTAESRLDEPGIAGGASVYVLFHGAIQHSLYHAAQIVLLKKAFHRSR